MQLIGLTRAAALTVLTFTLSAIPVWSQTNQNSFKRTPILYSQGRSNRDLAKTHFMRGNDYYKQEKWDLALAEYSKSIAIDSNYADAYNNRGNVYLNQKKLNLAVADYTRSIAINPNLGEAYNNRGLAYRQLGDFNKARENFQRAAQLHLAEGNTAAYQDTIKLVNSLERSGRGTAPVRSETLCGDNNFHYKNALEHMRNEVWVLALANLNQALELDPNCANIYESRGLFYYRQKQWDLALADFTLAIAINPNFPEAYYNRGEVYRKQRKWYLALVNYDKAIAINPNHANAYASRGSVYFELRDFNKARESYTIAKQLYKEQGKTSLSEAVTQLLNTLNKL